MPRKRALVDAGDQDNRVAFGPAEVVHGQSDSVPSCDVVYGHRWENGK
jgi:hypothetical protein